MGFAPKRVRLISVAALSMAAVLLALAFGCRTDSASHRTPGPPAPVAGNYQDDFRHVRGPRPRPAPRPAEQPGPGDGPRLAVPAPGEHQQEPVGTGPAVKPTVTVFMYHSLGDDQRPATIPAATFRRHLEYIRDGGYAVLSLRQFEEFLAGEYIPPAPGLLITFDDGYLDFYTTAFPLLVEFGYPATAFVNARYFDQEDDGRHLGPVQVAELLASGLVEVQGHSYDGHGQVPGAAGEGPFYTTRAYLPEAGREETATEYLERIRRDLDLLKEALSRVGSRGGHLAFPYGAFNDELIRVAGEAGFRYLYTTDGSAPNTPDTPLTAIHRVNVGSPWISDDKFRKLLPPFQSRAVPGGPAGDNRDHSGN